MEATEILVIFLSVALALFLLLAIVLTIYLIRLAQKAERIADTVQGSADTLASISDEIHSAVAPATIAKAIGDIADKFMRYRGGSRGSRRRSYDDEEDR